MRERALVSEGGRKRAAEVREDRMNGKKVETKTTLCENDEIQIGDTIFVLKVLA